MKKYQVSKNEEVVFDVEIEIPSIKEIQCDRHLVEFTVCLNGLVKDATNNIVTIKHVSIDKKQNKFVFEINVNSADHIVEWSEYPTENKIQIRITAWHFTAKEKETTGFESFTL